MKGISIIILLNQLMKIDAAVCGFDPTCDCDGTKVTCTGSPFPTNFPISTTHIQITHNENLVTVPSGAFTGLVNLQVLRLHSNAITTLPSDIFAGLTSLREIELQYNELTSLPDGVFSGLTSIVEIEIYENLITTFPISLFTDLTTLESLDLEDNPTKCCSMLDVYAFGLTLDYFYLTCTDFNQSVDYDDFNTSLCQPPVDGQWSDWIESGCSVTCGSGTIQRARSCDNPAPQDGGQQCMGDSFEEVPCTLSNCPGEDSCEDGNGICLPKKFRCHTQLLDKKCGSCHQKCCERKYDKY